MIRGDLVATHHRDAAVRDRGRGPSGRRQFALCAGASHQAFPRRHAASRDRLASCQQHLLARVHARTALAVAGGLPTLEIASMNSNGRPHSELTKIAVTLTAMAVMAHTG